MALILTFLGKGGSGRTTVALAAAKKYASSGYRVLFFGQDPTPALGLILGTSVTATPTAIAPNLEVVQMQATLQLEQAFEELKGLEKQYLRSPLLKNVYGQELGILPGMDGALALNSLWQYDKSGKYDVIIYDGAGDISTLRILGSPEILSWYGRRFSKVLGDSDVVKGLSPFVQPISSVLLNFTFSFDSITQEANNPAKNLVEEAKAVINDPNRVAAYLVTTSQAPGIATAKYLWGSAQQIGLTVGGVLLNQGKSPEAITTEFSPLSITSLPTISEGDWQPLMDALPDFKQAYLAPKPLTIDTANRQVKVFLPGFDKKQVKLTQSGPEITIEAGDQRRNLILPPPLGGQSVKGAKFQEGYLIISL